MLFALLFILYAPCASAFTVGHSLCRRKYGASQGSEDTKCRRHDQRTSRTFTGIYFAAFSLEEDDDTTFETSIFGTSSRTTELWLDLRGTAIAPREALTFLSQNIDNLTDTAPGATVVDRVLVSQDFIERALQLNQEGDPKALYVSEVDGSVRSVTDHSEVYGVTVNIANDFADPIPALDAVSSGGWAIIDSDGIKEEKDRADAISSLVEFVAAGSSSPGGSFLLGSEGGGLLDGSSDKGDEASYCTTNGMGGIAISCRKKADIVAAGALLQASLSGGIVTTESGILLQGNSEGNGARDGSAESAERSLNSALLLPFDALLWNTAIFLFQ